MCHILCTDLLYSVCECVACCVQICCTMFRDLLYDMYGSEQFLCNRSKFSLTVWKEPCLKAVSLWRTREFQSRDLALPLNYKNGFVGEDLLREQTNCVNSACVCCSSVFPPSPIFAIALVKPLPLCIPYQGCFVCSLQRSL